MANLDGELVLAVIHNKHLKKDIVAYYNPKEISLDRSARWESKSVDDTHFLEFVGDSPPMTLSCELFCDLYEEQENVDPVFVEPLLSLTRVRDESNEGDYRRPPLCVFIWGRHFRRFHGVVESVAIKYTMFLANGKPCRATASIKMKQAGIAVCRAGGKQLTKKLKARKKARDLEKKRGRLDPRPGAFNSGAY